MLFFVPGVPDFALHAQLGMPPLGGDPFWPSLGFPPGMFAPGLGLPWNPAGSSKPPQLSVPSFHALISQYMLAGGAAGLPGLPVGIPMHHPHHPNVLPPSNSISPLQNDDQDRNRSPQSSHNSHNSSPAPISPSEENRRNSIDALRLRAQEHLLMEHQRIVVPKPKPVHSVQAKS